MKRQLKAGLGTPRAVLRNASRLTRIAYKNILNPALKEVAKETTGRTITSGIQSIAQNDEFSPAKILKKAFPSSKQEKTSLQKLLTEKSNNDLNRKLFKSIGRKSLISPKKTRKNKYSISKTPRTPKKMSKIKTPRTPIKKILSKKRTISKISPLKYSK